MYNIEAGNDYTRSMRMLSNKSVGIRGWWSWPWCFLPCTVLGGAKDEQIVTCCDSLVNLSVGGSYGLQISLVYELARYDPNLALLWRPLGMTTCKSAQPMFNVYLPSV